MKKGYLYFVVALSGAAVLAIEILGTRILGPFYGVSLFLWSALITVTLAALSVGYALGGWWADRGATMLRLNFLLFAAGGWLVLVPWLKQYLLNLAEPLGLRWALLFAAFILFFPPLTLLGIVSPYAIKLRATNLNEIGRTAGNLYAISTVASVVAALLTGFYLIPSVGVNRLTWLIGLVLIFTAIGGFVFHRWRKVGLITILIGLICGSTAPLLFPGRQLDAASGLLFFRQSPYGEIHVVDREDTRYLLIDGAIHSMIQKDTWEPLQAYAIAMDLNRLFFQKPGEMLLIGLGGGVISKSFAQNGWHVTAVEIDPVVIEAARNFFHLNLNACQIYHADGRQFLLNHPKKYDLIILDAFGSSSIPFHLITREYFQLLTEHLKSDGVVAINVETIGWESQLVKAVTQTLKVHFKRVLALPINEPPNVLGNVVLIAANRALQFNEDFLGFPADYVDIDDYLHWVVVQRNHAWNNRFEPDVTGVAVLTDELNPIDIWSENINQAVRLSLNDFFDLKPTIW